MSPQYGELRPTSGWDRFVSLGHPSKFQRVWRLGSVTARHSSSGRQPNFAALNRGRHLYSAGRPSRWALAHILVMYEFIIGLLIISQYLLGFDSSIWIRVILTYLRYWYCAESRHTHAVFADVRVAVIMLCGWPCCLLVNSGLQTWENTSLYLLILVSDKLVKFGSLDTLEVFLCDVRIELLTGILAGQLRVKYFSWYVDLCLWQQQQQHKRWWWRMETGRMDNESC